MFEATQDGLGRNAPVHSIHGSLLAVGELLRFIETVKFYLINICIPCRSYVSVGRNVAILE